ncbi:short-chain dehydrogenase [Psychroflexus sp. ALD_RP9]|uniref:short-chain dehydrogenase n=1 Tax=Psychroflexus sp. ALD_RP9 TaxID=2777186 RepID=UPI001A8FCD53|nr:short-chain dehydrogenase [Psychroflexus sp. ALD_RP9]QSS96218.1 short-chain dehydrogenase [Psychroflexus sp. ALD_RP9]
MNNKLGILGCGWLGKALAKHFIGKGVQVNASATTSTKLEELKKLGASAYCVKVTPLEILGDVESFFSPIEALVISIPPQLRKQSSADFLDSVRVLAREISKYSNIKKVLYISSTSVFIDHVSIPVYHEDYKFSSIEIDQNPVLKSEFILRAELPTVKILRFGGLIGNDRHPIHFLAGKSNIKSPEAPVNLIQQSDCVSLIDALLDKFHQLTQICFHGVSTQHPKRRYYYLKKAKELQLEPPNFDEDSVSSGKLISSQLTIKTLKKRCFKAL